MQTGMSVAPQISATRLNQLRRPSAPKPVSATTAAKGSAGSSTFTVLLTMACCCATFFSQEMKQR